MSITVSIKENVDQKYYNDMLELIDEYAEDLYTSLDEAHGIFIQSEDDGHEGQVDWWINRMYKLENEISKVMKSRKYILAKMEN